MTQWINFKLLKVQLTFEAVLSHYGVAHVRDGPHHVKCSCPFHEDARPSMGIDLQKKIWQCFACKTSGNVLDFVTRMEGHDPAQPGAVRQGAEAAMAILALPVDAHDEAKPSGVRRFEGRRQDIVPDASNDVPGAPPSEPSHEQDDEPPVLTFELKLDAPPANLLKPHGVSKASVETFGLGLAKRGMMKERLCFPLHNLKGELIGYAGYWANGDPPEGVPLWLYPPKFALERFVFNAHRIADDQQPALVVTSSLWEVARLHDARFAAVGLPDPRAWEACLLKLDGITDWRVMVLDDDPQADELLNRLLDDVFVRRIAREALY